MGLITRTWLGQALVGAIIWVLAAATPVCARSGAIERGGAVGLAATERCVVRGAQLIPPGVLVIVAAALIGHTLVVGLLVACRARRTSLALGALGDGVAANRRLRAVADAFDVRVVLIDSPVLLCHCVGLLRPRVLVSTATLEVLDDVQLRAVMAHEAAHVHRRDTLELVVAQAYAATWQWLFPRIGSMVEARQLAIEMTADDRAIEQTSQRALARSLAAFLETPTPRIAATGASSVLRHRMARLLEGAFDEAAAVPPGRSRTATAVAVIAILIALGFALMPISRPTAVEVTATGPPVVVGPD